MATTTTPAKKTSLKKVTLADKILLFDGAIPTFSMYRRLRCVRENRKNLRSNAETGVWSGRKKRKQYCKVCYDTVINFHKWISDHPHVVQSPIANDNLLVNCHNGKIKAEKPLLQCSYI